MDLSDWRVVVTGAGAGIGRALAIALSRSGAYVVLLGRRFSKLEETASLLPSSAHYLLVTADLAVPSSICAACDQIQGVAASIDLLVNNAAPYVVGGLEETSAEEIAMQVSATVTGSMLVTRHLLPALRASGRGHLINILSTASLPSWEIGSLRSSVAFYAAKWGQAGFTEALRSELEGQPIKVTGIYPGAVANQSSLDDPPEKVLADFGPGQLGVKDVVDAMMFAINQSPRAVIRSLVITPE